MIRGGCKYPNSGDTAVSDSFSCDSDSARTVITGTGKGEQSIGSDTTPGSGWNSVICGGALVGTESGEYVMAQNVLYVNEQRGKRANLDRHAWSYDGSWSAAGVGVKTGRIGTGGRM